MGWDGMGWDCPIPFGALIHTSTKGESILMKEMIHIKITKQASFCKREFLSG
jgi:hypothetical protein